MGRIAKVLDFIRRSGGKSDTKCDPGGGAIRQAPHAQPAGDDGHPLPGDYAVLVEVPQAGGYSAVGYVDPRNAQTAGLGERRIYARSADGAQVVELWLKSDGSAKLSNADGYSELKASGEVDINGCIIGTDGSVTSPSKLAAPSILGDDSELVGHRHPGIEVGDGVSGPNQPGDGGGGGGFGPAADNTWSGANTFEQPVTVADPTAPEHAATLGTVGEAISGLLTDPQTWGGVQTFTEPPQVPPPVSDSDAANMAYVDAQIAAAGGGGGGYLEIDIVVSGVGYQGTVSAKMLSVSGTAGGATLRNISLVFDGATAGAGGLDTGTISAGNWYRIYVIYNPATLAVAALLSLSATTPVLPPGFTMARRVGNAYVAAATSAFRAQEQADDVVSFGTGGVQDATSPVNGGTSTVLTAVDLSASMPDTAKRVALLAATASGTLACYTGPELFGGTFSTSPTVTWLRPKVARTVYYRMSVAGTGFLRCFGYEDRI